jgi:hypothetical protein
MRVPTCELQGRGEELDALDRLPRIPGRQVLAGRGLPRSGLRGIFAERAEDVRRATAGEHQRSRTQALPTALRPDLADPGEDEVNVSGTRCRLPRPGALERVEHRGRASRGNLRKARAQWVQDLSPSWAALMVPGQRAGKNRARTHSSRARAPRLEFRTLRPVHRTRQPGPTFKRCASAVWPRTWKRDRGLAHAVLVSTVRSPGGPRPPRGPRPT